MWAFCLLICISLCSGASAISGTEGTTMEISSRGELREVEGASGVRRVKEKADSISELDVMETELRRHLHSQAPQAMVNAFEAAAVSAAASPPRALESSELRRHSNATKDPVIVQSTHHGRSNGLAGGEDKHGRDTRQAPLQGGTYVSPALIGGSRQGAAMRKEQSQKRRVGNTCPGTTPLYCAFSETDGCPQARPCCPQGWAKLRSEQDCRVASGAEFQLTDPSAPFDLVDESSVGSDGSGQPSCWKSKSGGGSWNDLDGQAASQTEIICFYVLHPDVSTNQGGVVSDTKKNLEVQQGVSPVLAKAAAPTTGNEEKIHETGSSAESAKQTSSSSSETSTAETGEEPQQGSPAAAPAQDTTVLKGEDTKSDRSSFKKIAPWLFICIALLLTAVAFFCVLRGEEHPKAKAGGKTAKRR